jgi:hypothetical protein
MQCRRTHVRGRGEIFDVNRLTQSVSKIVDGLEDPLIVAVAIIMMWLI